MLTDESPEGEDGGPEAGHEAVGVDGVGEAALYRGLVRVRESADDRGAQSKSVNCHSDDNGRQRFVEWEIFERTFG